MTHTRLKETKTMKVGDKITTLVNGFNGEVRVCEIVKITDGYADCKWDDGGRLPLFTSLSACTPYDGDEPIGTLVDTKPAIDPIQYFTSRAR